jgi:arsenate reductase
MPVIIYHNPRCSKSRATLALLREQRIEPAIVHYLDDPPAPERLRDLAAMLAVAPAEMVRTGEKKWRELGLDINEVADEELFRLMHEYPVLMQRPIVVADSRARIGRPPEAVLEILSRSTA